MKSFNSTNVGEALLAAIPVMATNGYFAHGYGLKAKGMGGVATAMAEDSFGGANNPASMVWVGTRLDLGLDWFRPERSADRTGPRHLACRAVTRWEAGPPLDDPRRAGAGSRLRA